MTERLRIAVRWVVVAVLAILALLGQRSASAPAELPAPALRPTPIVAPVPAVEQPPAPAVPGTAAALETLVSGTSCNDRLAAVEELRVARDPSALPALTSAARLDPCVTDAARAAIRELGRAERAAY